jgi:hypothetical protein
MEQEQQRPSEQVQSTEVKYKYEYIQTRYCCDES